MTTILPDMAAEAETMTQPIGRSIFGARLDRRRFLAVGGALVVALGAAPGGASAASGNSLDATESASWIEIHADGTFLIRTGKCDFGQSTIYTAYLLICAEK